MVKKCIVIFAMIFIAFTSTPQLSAGRGGYLYCSNCSYKSSEIYLGSGQESSSQIVFCPTCRDYKSIICTYILDDGTLEEQENKSPDLLCPACKTICEQVNEYEIWKVLWLDEEQTLFLACPRCGKNTLYLKIEFLWD